MSVKLMSLVWEYGPANTTQRFVLLALANYGNDDGDGIYPSFATIAERCAITRRTAIRAVNVLLDSGYLVRIRRSVEGRPTSNAYRINVSKLTGSDTASPATAAVVTDDHYPSDMMSPQWCQDVTTLVTDDHRPSDTVSPDPLSDPLPDPPLKRERKRRGRTGDDFSPPRRPEAFADASPAMEMLHEVTGYWPGQMNRLFLDERLGYEPDEAALRQAVTLWRAAGFRINNLAGICDWYDELRRDPAWRPAGGAAASKRSGKPTAAVLTEIEPGLY